MDVWSSQLFSMSVVSPFKAVELRCRQHDFDGAVELAEHCGISLDTVHLQRWRRGLWVVRGAEATSSGRGGSGDRDRGGGGGGDGQSKSGVEEGEEEGVNDNDKRISNVMRSLQNTLLSSADMLAAKKQREAVVVAMEGLKNINSTKVALDEIISFAHLRRERDIQGQGQGQGGEPHIGDVSFWTEVLEEGIRRTNEAAQAIEEYLASCVTGSKRFDDRYLLIENFVDAELFPMSFKIHTPACVELVEDLHQCSVFHQLTDIALPIDLSVEDDTFFVTLRSELLDAALYAMDCRRVFLARLGKLSTLRLLAANAAILFRSEEGREQGLCNSGAFFSHAELSEFVLASGATSQKMLLDLAYCLAERGMNEQLLQLLAQHPLSLLPSLLPILGHFPVSCDPAQLTAFLPVSDKLAPGRRAIYTLTTATGKIHSNKHSNKHSNAHSTHVLLSEEGKDMDGDKSKTPGKRPKVVETSTTSSSSSSSSSSIASTSTSTSSTAAVITPLVVRELAPIEILIESYLCELTDSSSSSSGSNSSSSSSTSTSSGSINTSSSTSSSLDKLTYLSSRVCGGGEQGDVTDFSCSHRDYRQTHTESSPRNDKHDKNDTNDRDTGRGKGNKGITGKSGSLSHLSFSPGVLCRWYLGQAARAEGYGLSPLSLQWLTLGLVRCFHANCIDADLCRVRPIGTPIDKPIDIFRPETEENRLLLFSMEWKIHLQHFCGLLCKRLIHPMLEFNRWLSWSPRRRVRELLLMYFQLTSSAVGNTDKNTGHSIGQSIGHSLGQSMGHTIGQSIGQSEQRCIDIDLPSVISYYIRPLHEGRTALYQYMSPCRFSACMLHFLWEDKLTPVPVSLLKERDIGVSLHWYDSVVSTDWLSIVGVDFIASDCTYGAEDTYSWQQSLAGVPVQGSEEAVSVRHGEIVRFDWEQVLLLLLLLFIYLFIYT
jgi:hypothetical protein